MRATLLPVAFSAAFLVACSNNEAHPKTYVDRSSIAPRGTKKDLITIMAQICLRDASKKPTRYTWIAWTTNLSGIDWEVMQPTSSGQARYRLAYGIDRPPEVNAIAVALDPIKNEQVKQYVFVPPRYLPLEVSEDWTPWQTPTLTAYSTEAQFSFLGTKVRKLPPAEPATDETPRIRYHLVRGQDFRGEGGPFYPADGPPC